MEKKRPKYVMNVGNNIYLYRYHGDKDDIFVYMANITKDKVTYRKFFKSLVEAEKYVKNIKNGLCIDRMFKAKKIKTGLYLLTSGVYLVNKTIKGCHYEKDFSSEAEACNYLLHVMKSNDRVMVRGPYKKNNDVIVKKSVMVEGAKYEYKSGHIFTFSSLPMRDDNMCVLIINNEYAIVNYSNILGMFERGDIKLCV